MKTYPISLINLESKHNIVVGGGKVALRKVKSLLDAGADVTLICPEAEPELANLSETGQITWEKRTYQSGDLSQAFLVIAATNQPIVNQQIWHEAMQAGCLVNVVDDPQHSNFILPAVIHRGEINIAISTGGASPALARRLREKLDEIIDPEYAQLAEILAELRPELVNLTEPGEQRLQVALQLVDSELVQIIRNQGKNAALAYARQQLRQVAELRRSSP